MPTNGPAFTVCVLLYGDHPELARRVLRSLNRPEWHDWFNLRVGFNNVSDNMFFAAGEQAAFFGQDANNPKIPVQASYVGKEPFVKYPLMKRMFHDDPITTPYTMWFDDDSWVFDAAPANWFELVFRRMVDADMLGAVWYIPYQGQQREFIKRYSWYTGKQRERFEFATGGWWTIRTDIINHWKWPPPELHHNGGDALLGELMFQQGYRLRNFSAHLGINADSTGKCSTAKRRGHSETPIGVRMPRAHRRVVLKEPDWQAKLAGEE